jgi:spermidine synthase
LFILIVLTNKSKLNSGIFIGSLAASSIEIIILFSFQINYGTVYKMIGVIVAVFMLGLWIGNRINFNHFKLKPEFLMKICQILPTILLILFPAFQLYFKHYYIYYQWVGYFITILFVLVSSFIFGLQFNLATRIATSLVAGNAIAIYNYDLIGSSIGILATSLLALPILGITNSCFLLALINLFFFFCNILIKK